MNTDAAEEGRGIPTRPDRSDPAGGPEPIRRWALL